MLLEFRWAGYGLYCIGVGLLTLISFFGIGRGLGETGSSAFAGLLMGFGRGFFIFGERYPGRAFLVMGQAL